MIRYKHSDGRVRNVLVDCGKTFYEAALAWCPKYKMRRIDGVLLTHGHADAIMGLDDLRNWTIGGDNAVQSVVHVYLDQATMDVVSRAFPYLVDIQAATGGGDVPRLEFHLIETVSGSPMPFYIEELQVVPFLGMFIVGILSVLQLDAYYTWND